MKTTLLILSLLFINCTPSHLTRAQINTIIALGCDVYEIDERDTIDGRLIRVRFYCPEKCCQCPETEEE